MVGTCRHFAVLSCALLRYRGIPARARCGFATYFEPGKGLDHWVTEYWDQHGPRRVRIDSEILGQQVLSHPEDLQPGEFLSGERPGTLTETGGSTLAVLAFMGLTIGVRVSIRGNLVKDLAALNNVEMLPWDVWGRMKQAYRDEAGADYDELLDEVAAACAADDPVALTELYARDELCVPAGLAC